jgi:hypothetical protein
VNPYIAAAIATVVSVILKLHLTVHAGALTVTVWLPLAIAVTLAAAILAGVYLILRELTGFRLLGSWA